MVVGVVVAEAVEGVEGRKRPPRPSHYHQSRDRLSAFRKRPRPPVYPEALRLVRLTETQNVPQKRSEQIKRGSEQFFYVLLQFL